MGLHEMVNTILRIVRLQNDLRDVLPTLCTTGIYGWLKLCVASARASLLLATILASESESSCAPTFRRAYKMLDQWPILLKPKGHPLTNPGIFEHIYCLET